MVENEQGRITVDARSRDESVSIQEVDTIMVSELQRVFFVRRGRVPVIGAIPIVLVDAALQHRYADTIELRVMDGPQGDALPVRVINPQEVPLVRDARFGVIIDDRRSGTVKSPPA